MSFSLGNFFRTHPHYFYVWDIGSFSVKGALASKDNEGNALVHAVAEEQFAEGDMEGDAIMSLEGVKERCRKVRTQLVATYPSGHSARESYAEISGTQILGQHFTQFYARENPHSDIDIAELKHMLQNIEQRAYEALRKTFARETGQMETDVYVINAFVQEVKIDGYHVSNPLGFQGREVGISIFNAYLARAYFAVLQELFSSLSLQMQGVFYEPMVISEELGKTLGAEYNALLLNMGGYSSTVSAVRKGHLENVATLPFGSHTFTEKIARELGIGLQEAEHIKMQYNEGTLSETVLHKLSQMLENESNIFLRGLELILSDFSQKTLLPSTVYLLGGGTLFSHIQRILKKKEWRASLSFLQPMKIITLGQDIFPIPVEQSDFTYNARFAPLLALAQYASQEGERREEILFKTLKRMLKLIQE